MVVQHMIANAVISILGGSDTLMRRKSEARAANGDGCSRLRYLAVLRWRYCKTNIVISRTRKPGSG